MKGVPVRYRARKTVRLGPIRLNFTQRGFASWAIKIGPWTWNATRGTHSLDTPGPGGVTWGRKRAGR
ncbi:hypothetical protein WY02_03630 [Pseudonocardia sp. AL041005-10]|nr:hypothetical protein WY02_03630 [Pseudonocardia sp. AL041005-10]